MLDQEIKIRIKDLVTCNTAMVQILQDIICEFGYRYPRYDLKDWRIEINAVIDKIKNSELQGNNLNTTIPIPIAKESNDKSVQKPTDIANSHKLNLKNTSKEGAYIITFLDGYVIEELYCKDIFKLFVRYVGPYSIKQFGLKINGKDIISYERIQDGSVQYPILQQCYLFVEFDDNTLAKAMYDICIALNINAKLCKGSNVIFDCSTKIDTTSNEQIEKYVPSLVSNIPTMENSTIIYNNINVKPKDLKYYIDILSKMKASKVNGVYRPYKGVLLLAIFKGIHEKKITSPIITLSPSIIDLYNQCWDKFVINKTRFERNVASAYVHLSTDGFFRLTLRRSIDGALNSSWTPDKVEIYCKYATLDQEMFDLLSDDENYESLASFVIDRFGLYKPTNLIKPGKSTIPNTHIVDYNLCGNGISINEYDDDNIVVSGEIRPSKFYLFRDRGGYLKNDSKYGICWIVNKKNLADLKSALGLSLPTATVASPRQTNAGNIQRHGIEYYLEEINNISISNSGKINPQKSILLITIFQAISAGKIKDNKIILTENLKQLFFTTWRQYVPNSFEYECNIALPFIELNNEKFYTLMLKKNFSPSWKVWTIDRVQRYCSCAIIDSELFDYAKNQVECAKLISEIVIKHKLLEIKSAQKLSVETQSTKPEIVSVIEKSNPLYKYEYGFKRFLMDNTSFGNYSLESSLIQKVIAAASDKYIISKVKSIYGLKSLYELRETGKIQNIIGQVKIDLDRSNSYLHYFYMMRYYMYFIEKTVYKCSVTPFLKRLVEEHIDTVSDSDIKGFYTITIDSTEITGSDPYKMVINAINFIGKDAAYNVHELLGNYEFITKTRAVELYREYRFLDDGYWLNPKGSFREIGTALKNICDSLGKEIKILYLR